uniref:Uncharacterized protein n=1 Tax=Myotis myotis TaxID=51298 RepID=A0A7J7RFQ1_MYOMY|nr:hypothetical protein mMyoMyo1_010364 [Myotis myotis]
MPSSCLCFLSLLYPLVSTDLWSLLSSASFCQDRKYASIEHLLYTRQFSSIFPVPTSLTSPFFLLHLLFLKTFSREHLLYSRRRTSHIVSSCLSPSLCSLGPLPGMSKSLERAPTVCARICPLVPPCASSPLLDSSPGHQAPSAPTASLWCPLPQPPTLPPVPGPPFSPGPSSREDSVHILSDPCAPPHLHTLLLVPLAPPLLSAPQAMSWGGGGQALTTCCVLFPKPSPFFLPLCLPSPPPITTPRPAFSGLSARGERAFNKHLLCDHGLT